MPQKPKLPQYVRNINGRYDYRPYIPVKQRHLFQTDKYGYLRPPIRLCSSSEPEHRMYAAYAKAKEQLLYEKAPGRPSLNWLAREYLQSRFYKELSPDTQRRYAQCHKSLMQHPLTVNGHEATLGDLDSTCIKTTTIRHLLDRRLEKYQQEGKKGTAQCNNERAFLSSVFRYGIQYVDELADRTNPCHGIKTYRVAVRNRYVTDEEYQVQYQFAQQYSQPYMPPFMELSYLLAARGVEIHDLTIGCAIQQGVIVKRRKGSKGTLVRWSSRLHQAWDTLLTMHKVASPASSKLLLVKQSAVETAWQRMHTDMIRAGLEKVYFQLHDLKRKGISDAKDDRIAGHKSDQIRANYNVKLQEFEPPK